MARIFNGSTDVISGGNNPPNTFFGGNWTIAGWVLSTGGGSFCGFTLSTHFVQMFVHATNHDFEPFFTSGGAGNTIATGVSIVNAWHHCALTAVAASTVTAYVDGVAHGSLANNGVINVSTPFQIGNDNAGDPLAGSAADIAIWSAALTATELLGLTRGMRPYQIRPASLGSWWPLDGLQSPEPDLSGNANNGTLTGTAKAAGPPFSMFTPRWPLFTAVAASTFQAAWARGKNIVVDGVAT